MADFRISFRRTAALEGGYQAKPSDGGNFCAGQLVGTNRGISAPTLRDYLGRCPTVAEMKAVTPALAEHLYRTNYWVPVQGDGIANQSVADLIFDFAINSGTGTAVGHVQEALGALGHAVAVDGVMGPRTLAAVNGANQAALFEEVKDRREALMRRLAASSANYREWLSGWLQRLDKFLFVSESAVAGNEARGLAFLLIVLALGALAFYYRRPLFAALGRVVVISN